MDHLSCATDAKKDSCAVSNACDQADYTAGGPGAGRTRATGLSSSPSTVARISHVRASPLDSEAMCVPAWSVLSSPVTYSHIGSRVSASTSRYVFALSVYPRRDVSGGNDAGHADSCGDVSRLVDMNLAGVPGSERRGSRAACARGERRRRAELSRLMGDERRADRSHIRALAAGLARSRSPCTGYLRDGLRAAGGRFAGRRGKHAALRLKSRGHRNGRFQKAWRCSYVSPRQE